MTGAGTTLIEHLATAFEDGDSDGAAGLAIERLEQSLATGDFILVVAAPEIPDGVQRVLEYLNARGQRFYALEVSYFRGPAECFVPRLVVMPPVSGGRTGPTAPAWEPEAFIDALPAHVRDAVRTFLAEASQAGADLVWQSYGLSVKVMRGKTRQVAYLEPKRLGATIQASGGFPEEPFAEVARRLAVLNVGQASDKGWWHIAAWTEMSEGQAQEALGIVLDGIHALVEPPNWTAIDPARSLTFDRNDHNIWTKHVPGLADLQGQRLRGSLRRAGTGEPAAMELVPLAGSAAGWRPRFTDGGGDALWPAGVYEGNYELVVDALAT